MRKAILIIDDDKAICWLLEELLKKQYTVTSMADGMKAMQWMAGGHLPDMIITDIDMPNLDGIELLRNLSRSGLYRDIPVLILSGWDNKEQRAKCIESGAFEYLLKPFDPNNLLNLVKEALSLNKAQSHV